MSGFGTKKTNAKPTFGPKLLTNHLPIADKPIVFGPKLVAGNFKHNQSAFLISSTALQNLAALTSAEQDALAVHEPMAVFA